MQGGGSNVLVWVISMPLEVDHARELISLVESGTLSGFQGKQAKPLYHVPIRKSPRGLEICLYLLSTSPKRPLSRATRVTPIFPGRRVLFSPLSLYSPSALYLCVCLCFAFSPCPCKKPGCQSFFQYSRIIFPEMMDLDVLCISDGLKTASMMWSVKKRRVTYS